MSPPAWINTAISAIGRPMMARRRNRAMLALLPWTTYLTLTVRHAAGRMGRRRSWGLVAWFRPLNLRSERARCNDPPGNDRKECREYSQLQGRKIVIWAIGRASCREKVRQ